MASGLSPASGEFYGDSDAASQLDSEDENPFLDKAAPSAKDSNSSGRCDVTKHSAAWSDATLTQDQCQAFSADKQFAVGFPTITGRGSASFGDTAAYRHRSGSSLNAESDAGVRDPRLWETQSEVETEVETEGETEDDESGSEQERAGRAAAAKGEPARRAASKEDWSKNVEQDWIELIEYQLKRARDGRPDAHAMRRVLRKAGFVPAFLRKDVWRLLILGRVEASDVDGGGVGEVLAIGMAILSTELDLENQRVVRVDVERTRPALDQFKRPRVKNMLARILTHHCKTHGLGYKQGMHEVLAPFVALSDPELSASDISLCYSAFIKRFLPYAFNKDEEFISLQICFRLFRLLLLYHHPRLCRFLDQYQLQPELYATPWFMTLFSSSLDLPRLYEIWDFYLYWGDPALHHFVVLAFVIGNAGVILKAEEANLPETMCRLTEGMRSVEELRALMRTAKGLMLNTPKSFRKILRSALYANLSQSQMNLVLNTLQVTSCIPVSAEEITSYILHKNPHRQLDQDSDEEELQEEEEDIGGGGGRTGLRSIRDDDASGYRSQFLQSPPNGLRAEESAGGQYRASVSPQRRAERAAMRSLRGHRQYIILDCRPRHEFDSCRLAPALHLDPELLMSPEKLDAKLKEFMPLQGVAHFCLVGAGGDAGSGTVGQRKNTPPTDLSGEAMGLRTASGNKADSPKERSGSAGDTGSRTDRGGDDRGGSTRKADGGGGFGRAAADGNKDGGFFGGFSRALSRGYGAAVEREGEEEVGKEEDVQVARFVLMLLQYNFPFITHVRGDMAACLEELSSQALEEREKGNQHVVNGASHETLHGVLIGTDSDRVLEKLMQCSPAKMTEGLFAGLSRWSKDKANSMAGSGIGVAGGKAEQAAHRGGDAISSAKTSAVTAASRGRGGLGRRDADDLNVLVKAQDQAQKKTPTKRRLFGGVMDRFDKPDNDRAAGGGGDPAAAAAAAAGTVGPAVAFADVRPQWLSPDRSRVTTDPESTEAASASAFGSVAEAETNRVGKAAAGVASTRSTWTKPAAAKRKETPDRFARFLGKMLGVKDDALPDRSIDMPNGTIDDERPAVGNGSGGSGGGKQPAALERLPSPAGGTCGGAETAEQRAEGGGGQPNEQVEPTRRAPVGSDLAAAGAHTTTTTVTTATTAAAAVAVTPRATAVYTAASTAAADAMPVAVAVAVPVAGEAVVARDPAASVRRPSRTSRPPAGITQTGEIAGVGTGEAVSISGWIATEERETGGVVRMFSAQRVLEGKVQRKCRLAVSPKNMTQFDNVQGGDIGGGGSRGVITEHRGLRHLSRITSRKKHADLIVFHFKSRSGSGASGTAAAAAAATAAASAAGAANPSSRRSRSLPTLPGNARQQQQQSDVLFYFMKEHADCLRMVKENYRKITQGGGGGGSSSPRVPSAATASAASASLEDQGRPPGRPNARAAAGAAAGAAGIVVGAAAGMAVGAAAGVAVGAAFLAGHRRGSHEERKSDPASYARRKERGSSEGSEGASSGRREEKRRSSGGWIPIDAPAPEARRGSDDGRGRGSPSTRGPSTASRRTGLSSNTGGVGRGQSRSTRAAAAGKQGSGAEAEIPSWLGRK